MAWFKRKDAGIKTSTEEKKDTPDGLWYKTPKGNIIHTRELKNNSYVCPDDDYHVKIGSKEYFEILFDDNQFKELDKDMTSGDPLSFTDSKSYTSRIKDSIAKTNLKDAARTGVGKLNGLDLVITCMDFNFIGGSMGSVVGEKIARAIDYALKHKVPFLMISKSGGARMMEAGFSLMQMAKTSAKLALLDDAGIPYISLMTDPTTGGVTASYAMLGDFNIAEPGALIGFAGPRVIRETIGKDLPRGFQSSEFVLEHGFLDFIIDRRQLKNRIYTLLNLLRS
ncbi:acetyl-CoA carboxylase carboxyl transferase subunit beta [Cyclobacterium xiamenense]|uniref:Acetyl-coenzyme A carboxylase carboxyl transferase subunit beta n=1 Tax=Cyclobacterium xiamenense TaxID=1297121 RepID=A0A1H7BE91_9BACT|nr:acetyl-CoA carboxylase, carboxyltransferase subunit beta [Cyclobacterium xiamenense]SEJ75516.1 acetyl-CoA carboxylase carboxyl transferase subunit beta [Cyclobacterium xiamenense]